jgi:hypothetical protein
MPMHNFSLVGEVFLYFILWVEVVKNSNLIWIQIGLEFRKYWKINSPFYFSSQPWAETFSPAQQQHSHRGQRHWSKRLWNWIRNELVTERDSPLLDLSPTNEGSSSVRHRIARTFSRLRSGARSPINSGWCPSNFCRKDRALGAHLDVDCAALPRPMPNQDWGKLPLPPPPP